MNTKQLRPDAPLWIRKRHLCGGGGGGGSGSYVRKGLGSHYRFYGNHGGTYVNQGRYGSFSPPNAPKVVWDNIKDAAASATSDPGLGAKQTDTYQSLMDQVASVTSQPGYAEIEGFTHIDPSSYSGRSALLGAASIDPFSTDYKAGTETAYKQSAADALAQVATGPNAVHGGDARSGLAWGTLADRLGAGRTAELRNAQMQDLNTIITSARSMNEIEGSRLSNALRAALGLNELASGTAERGLKSAMGVDMHRIQNLSALQVAAQLLGTTSDIQADNYAGQGDQSNWQAGVSCCFIFLEALNGKLPWFVEIARFDFLTPARRLGYKWMARWLVPLMQRFSLVKHAVNKLMVRPFLAYGQWLYANKGCGWAYAYYCHAWLYLWSWLGRRYG